MHLSSLAPQLPSGCSCAPMTTCTNAGLLARMHCLFVLMLRGRLATRWHSDLDA